MNDNDDGGDIDKYKAVLLLIVTTSISLMAITAKGAIHKQNNICSINNSKK